MSFRPYDQSHAERGCVSRSARMASFGAVLLGLAGFCAGFFGPMALNPGANQGPLVGLLITGPGGAVLGALLGAVLGAADVRGVVAWKILIGIAAAGMVVILFYALPAPQFRGNVLEVEVLACESPMTLKARAFDYWDKRIAAAPWAAARPDWKAGFEAMLDADPGVVLKVNVTRHIGLYENRKPWNKGTHKKGQAWWLKDQYFVGVTTCAEWPVGKRGVYAAQGDKRVSKQWPAEIMPNFLDLQVLTPAAAHQSALLY